MTFHPVVIIGAGPAGLATAIQLKRYGVGPLLLEAERIGGLLNNANLVENYPGFPHGIRGPELVKLIQQHAESSGVRASCGEVVRLSHLGDEFQIRTREALLTCRILVVASGTRAVRFADGLIPEEAGENVFYEVYPLSDVAGKTIAIVGAGDAAFDYALNLSRGNQVTILNRGKDIRCLPLLKERASTSANIHYRDETSIVRVSKVEGQGLQLNLQVPSGSESLQVDYLIGAIGRQPRLDFLNAEMLERIKSLEQAGRIYFVGDVRRGLYRQTAIAVGDGIRAAMMISAGIKESEL